MSQIIGNDTSVPLSTTVPINSSKGQKCNYNVVVIKH